ncbi:MAG: AMP-binding protein, partial [Micrococcales bacterium]|nr:AMP-binding protein [Micrococcales bacterium]
FPRLRAMLDGVGPLLLPYAPTGVIPDVEGSTRAYPSGLAVGTSGSTGNPKRAILPTDALRASVDATHDVLGGPGRWLLVLPPEHIAGLQVILRSLAADAEPALGTPGPFTAAGFVADVARARAAGGGCRYVSLVPTQLARLLDDLAATTALASFDAVLVGGAATGSDVLTRARGQGLRIVTTYGMSETAGGCVYNGRPLPGVQVAVRPDEAASEHGAADRATDRSPPGRIHLGGPTLALGYLPTGGTPAPRGNSGGSEGDAVGRAGGRVPFEQVDGRRWFRTDDLGTLEANTLQVLGRVDDLIVTGGLKVAPMVVQEAVARVLPGLDSVAFAVPDERWGHTVALALVAPSSRHEALRAQWPRIQQALRAQLPGPALPRRLVTVAELPLRGPGKPDRAALRALAPEQ